MELFIIVTACIIAYFYIKNQDKSNQNSQPKPPLTNKEKQPTISPPVKPSLDEIKGVETVKPQATTVSQESLQPYLKKPDGFTEEERDTLEKKRLQSVRSKKGGYKSKNLLNRPEITAKKAIRATIHRNDGFKKWDLLCQVSMGAFLSHPEDDDMYWAINAKRVDFLVTTKNGFPVAVIEIHGQGHYSDNALEKQIALYSDIVKYNACKSAGIIYIEISVSDDRNEIAETVSAVVQHELF